MLSMLRKRLHNDEDGFTLIELMVVVLIIAILLAIAIPTFLRAQDSAKDKSAESDLRNAVTAARTIATDDGGAFDNIAAELPTAEPNIDFSAATVADAVDGKVFVSVTTSSSADDTAILVTRSDTGTWFAAGTNESGEVVQCEGSTSGAVDTFDECKTLASGTGGTATS